MGIVGSFPVGSGKIPAPELELLGAEGLKPRDCMNCANCVGISAKTSRPNSC